MKPLLLSVVCISIHLTMTGLAAANGNANQSPQNANWPKHTWSIEVGFGEIPFLSGSFKPSVSFGYHVNQYFYVGWTVQLHDILERGNESFNAKNTGLGQIESTREVTGIRSLIGIRLRPHRFAPHLSAGMLFSGSDREVMHFADATRIIGSNTYHGSVTVVQTRPYAIRPAAGIGWGIQLRNGFSFSAEMTGAFFLRPGAPDIQVIHEQQLLSADRAVFSAQLKSEFQKNFHNRYHLFNIGAGYVW